MDAQLFANALSDKYIFNLKKLGYKYPELDMSEFISILKESVYISLPLRDFNGNSCVYMSSALKPAEKTYKSLMYRPGSGSYGLLPMENEIGASLSIESIDFSRESVRKILSGRAPEDLAEKRIYCMKQAIEFICNRENRINEENIYTLYMLACGSLAEDECRLTEGEHYRNDTVYVVYAAGNVEHSGLHHEKLSEYMADLIDFINGDNIQDSLAKACIIHFYMAYLHPYFDGNGRMARLMHQWFLVQSDFPSALFVSFSGLIESSRKKYYDAYTLCENNMKISGVMDLSPFISYFYKEIYPKLDSPGNQGASTDKVREFISSGRVTKKEKELWEYILSAYGTKEFSTKQLEKDFCNAAYATIRSFVMKFEQEGLLEAKNYSNRRAYRIC